MKTLNNKLRLAPAVMTLACGLTLLSTVASWAASYSSARETAIGRREVVDQKIADEAVELIQAKQKPSRELREMLEAKRAEIASSLGQAVAESLSDEALAALLLSE